MECDSSRHAAHGVILRNLRMHSYRASGDFPFTIALYQILQFFSEYANDNHSKELFACPGEPDLQVGQPDL